MPAGWTLGRTDAVLGQLVGSGEALGTEERLERDGVAWVRDVLLTRLGCQQRVPLPSRLPGGSVTGRGSLMQPGR